MGYYFSVGIIFDLISVGREQHSSNACIHYGGYQAQINTNRAVHTALFAIISDFRRATISYALANDSIGSNIWWRIHSQKG